MLNGTGSENGKKTNMSNSQNITLRVKHTLFAVVLHDYNVKSPLSYSFYAGNVVCVPVRYFFVHYRSFSR